MISPLHGSRQNLLMVGILFGAAVVLSADPARSQNQTFSDLGGRKSQRRRSKTLARKALSRRSRLTNSIRAASSRAAISRSRRRSCSACQSPHKSSISQTCPRSPLYEAVQAAAPFMDRRAICPACLVSSNFAPNAPISRAHAAISLARMEVASKKVALVGPREVNSALAGIPDVSGLSPLARQLIATAIKSGSITPSSGKAFEPAASYDRGDIAVVLFNTEKLLNARP